MSTRIPISNEWFRVLAEEVRPFTKGFDYVDDHVIVTDENGNILYANEAVKRKTGFSREESLGKNPGDLWGGKMPKEFYQHMWETVKIRKKPFVGEVENVRKDGTRYWQELHVYPLVGNKGEAKFFIGIEPDITERKEKEHMQKSFTRMVGHQLLPPLTLTKWFTEEILQDKDTLSVEQLKKLNKIYQSNDSLIQLVSDLLALAKSEDTALQKESVDIVQEIHDIVESTKTKNPHVAMEFVQQDGPHIIQMNKSLGLQVFTNLINNAAEYAAKKEGRAVVRIQKEHGDILFSAENNGLVIPKEDQEKIFSKLFRASNAKEAKEEGSGLGLFIVKMICNKFGWKVWFKSPREEGNGAIFFVRIPQL